MSATTAMSSYSEYESQGTSSSYASPSVLDAPPAFPAQQSNSSQSVQSPASSSERSTSLNDGPLQDAAYAATAPASSVQTGASPELPPLPPSQLESVPVSSAPSHTPSLSFQSFPEQRAPGSSDSSTYVQQSRSSTRGHERAPSIGTINGSWPAPSDLMEEVDVVPVAFDEGVLRALCELDCGVPLLLDRIKQGLVSCREVAAFLKKRAIVEEDYARSLSKVARTTAEQYSMSEGKAGSFVNAWHSAMRIHEVVAENRLRFAARLNEMSDELLTLAKEVERNRKQTKELAARYERTLQEAEATTDKAKNRFDATAEELERILVMKEGETMKEAGLQQTRSNAPGQSGKRVLGKAINKGGLLLKGKNPNSIVRQEEDVRQRMSNSSDTYRKAVLETQQTRQEYFNFQLPRILRSLKECADEIDLGTQYHLSRYAFLYESTLLGDGSALAPLPGPDSTIEGPGMKDIMENIDSKGDFKVYMQNYAIANGGQRGPRREGPPEEGFVPTISHHAHHPSIEKIPVNLFPETKMRATFGVDLGEQMARDSSEVPRILERCAAAIETYGLQSVGIYRLSGMTSRVNKLKAALDKDIETRLLDEEAASDVNIVSGALKLWLRELPEPLFTYALYGGFVEAAKVENDRLRHIRLHERVNDLPDANYATLKFLMGHLNRVQQQSEVNQMKISNLSIVFGPTLLGPPMTVNAHGAPVQDAAALNDNQWQSRAVETILEHYLDIFVEEGEEAP